MAEPSSVQPSQTAQAIRSGPITPQSAEVTGPRPVLQCSSHPVCHAATTLLCPYMTSVAFGGKCTNTLITQAPHITTFSAVIQRSPTGYFRIFTVNRTCLSRPNYEPAGQNELPEMTFLTWDSGWISGHIMIYLPAQDHMLTRFLKLFKVLKHTVQTCQN